MCTVSVASPALAPAVLLMNQRRPEAEARVSTTCDCGSTPSSLLFTVTAKGAAP